MDTIIKLLKFSYLIITVRGQMISITYNFKAVYASLQPELGDKKECASFSRVEPAVFYERTFRLLNDPKKEIDLAWKTLSLVDRIDLFTKEAKRLYLQDPDFIARRIKMDEKLSKMIPVTHLRNLVERKEILSACWAEFSQDLTKWMEKNRDMEKQIIHYYQLFLDQIPNFDARIRGIQKASKWNFATSCFAFFQTYPGQLMEKILKKGLPFEKFYNSYFMFQLSFFLSALGSYLTKKCLIKRMEKIRSPIDSMALVFKKEAHMMIEYYRNILAQIEEEEQQGILVEELYKRETQQQLKLVEGETEFVQQAEAFNLLNFQENSELADIADYLSRISPLCEQISFQLMDMIRENIEQEEWNRQNFLDLENPSVYLVKQIKEQEDRRYAIIFGDSHKHEEKNA